jgi:hypothetical protein
MRTYVRRDGDTLGRKAGWKDWNVVHYAGEQDFVLVTASTRGQGFCDEDQAHPGIARL